MSGEDFRIRQVADAFGRAIAPGPDDDAHLTEDVLDALADDALEPADQEWAVAHLEACPQCAEDLADRRAVRRAIDVAPGQQGRPAGGRPSRLWTIGLPAGLAAAAAVLLAVTLGRPASPPDTVEAARAAEVPAPDPLAGEDRALVSRVLAAGRLEIPDDIVALRGRMGTLLGETASGPALTLEAPVGTAVAGRRPEFRWSRVPDALSYTVRVYDEQFIEVARGRVTTTAWTPEADLEAGRVYVWQVTAHWPGGELTAPAPPRPEARFRILTEETSLAVARLGERLVGDALARGILEARAGLLDDAAASLTRAQTEAATRAVASALLASLPRHP